MLDRLLLRVSQPPAERQQIMFKVTKRTLTAAAAIAAASAPSAAYARFDVNPPPAGAGSGQTQSPTGPSVQPNPDESVLGHAHAPSAASPGHNARVASAVNCPPRAGRCISPASVPAHTTSVHSARPTVAASPEGFQWGDAGIGAAGMFLVLSAGGAAAIVGRRQRHSTATG
jgi:hypothetical protein